MSNCIYGTKENFETEVIKSDIPVLVDFWASWCGPCKMISPLLEDICEELEGKAKIVKVNIDEQPDLASQYGVVSIPTLLLFKDGQIIDKTLGAMPKARITAFISKAL